MVDDPDPISQRYASDRETSVSEYSEYATGKQRRRKSTESKVNMVAEKDETEELEGRKSRTNGNKDTQRRRGGTGRKKRMPLADLRALD